jgi:hypothetical protein
MRSKKRTILKKALRKRQRNMFVRIADAEASGDWKQADSLAKKYYAGNNRIHSLRQLEVQASRK